eukprot:TRINITY_DN87_c0_g1_i1.p1 TRINITY_DN87_c0_g1~~TRINITY_DN87_c0_g1_i1.p1  ORF type:complete len:151 (+),score=18.22 TRINITY_DN87_c0_g1_i1:60-512(+)
MNYEDILSDTQILQENFSVATSESTPAGNSKRFRNKNSKSKKKRNLLTETEVFENGKLRTDFLDFYLSNSLESDPESQRDILPPTLCIDSTKKVLALLNRLPSEDPQVTKLLQRCIQLRSAIMDHVIRADQQEFADQMLRYYDQLSQIVN